MEAGYLGPAIAISRLNLDAAIEDALEQMTADFSRKGFELFQDGQSKFQYLRRLSEFAL
jgi:hypothetical protein